MLFLFSLIALLCWSGSDLFGKLGTEEGDRHSQWKVGAAVGLVMGVHALYKITLGGLTVTMRDILLYLPASLLYIASMLFFYVGLRYIELSISSPICNASGGFALLFSLLWFGVKFVEDDSDAIYLNPAIIVGVILILAGIVGIGVVDLHEDEGARMLRQSESGKKYAKSFLAILFPILYCVLDSLGTFFDTLIADRYVSELLVSNPLLSETDAENLCADVLNTAYEFTWAAVAIVCVIWLYLIRKEEWKPKGAGLRLIGGLCETVGQVFYMFVVVSEYKVGLVIVSSYCALSLVWGRIFLKEKLSKWHYLVLALVLAGIVILGFEDV